MQHAQRPILLDAARLSLAAVRRAGRKIASLRERSVKVPADWKASEDVAGKTVLITGSTRGIGREAARLFARNGARVAVHGRSPQTACEVAAEIASETGGQTRGFGADLSESGAGARLVNEVIAAMGGIDVLINNAAVLPAHKRPAWQAPADELASVLSSNVTAAYEASTEAMRSMIESRRAGRIVFISSSVADMSRENVPTGLTAYGISKIALEGAAFYLADEGRRTGIVVTTLRAPTTATDMIATHVDWEMRAMQAAPADVAEAYLRAVTAPAESVHGQVNQL